MSKSRDFAPLDDKQTSISVQIYQGESRFVRDNILLGQLQIPIKRGQTNRSAIEVRFTYDINGILEVIVNSTSKNVEKRLVIEGNPGTMTPHEIAKRLTELHHLKIHPRDQDENRYMLAKAERLYQEHLGDVRDSIGERIIIFQHILERQNQKEIAQARKQLMEFIENLDRSLFT